MDFTARYAQIVIALVLGSIALASWFYLRSEDGTGKAHVSIPGHDDSCQF